MSERGHVEGGGPLLEGSAWLAHASTQQGGHELAGSERCDQVYVLGGWIGGTWS